MFPWIKDAADLYLACRALRLARDRHGNWRPAANREDIENAFSDIAKILDRAHLDCFDNIKRAEETERLRMCVQALTALAVAKGAAAEDVAVILESILTEALPTEGQEPPPGWTLVPAWARRRAKRRIDKAARKPGTPLVIEEFPPPIAAFP